MDAKSGTVPSELNDKLNAASVKYLLASYVDMHGVSKGKVVPVSHLGRMMSGS